MILQDTVKGKTRRGTQNKRWEVNIKRCTGTEFASSTSAFGNKTRWKGIVVQSSVLPNDLARL